MRTTRGPTGAPYPVEGCPIYAALRSGAPESRATEVFWRADGSPVPIDYTVTPLPGDDDGGGPRGAVVAFGRGARLKRLRAAGADGYLTKPFTFDGLHAVIDGVADEGGAEVDAGARSAAPPVLDPKAIEALRRLADSPQVGVSAIGELLQTFFADVADRIPRLEAAIAEEDLPLVRQEAHTLRSSCAWAGAVTAAGLCRELESAAKRGDAAAVRSRAGKLGSALALARGALEVEFSLEIG